MDHLADIVLPVFGLIGIGYCVAWSKVLGDDPHEALSEFVFVIAIPLLVFRILATADLSGISAWRLWLPYFAVFAFNWAAGTFLIRRFFGRDARAGLVAGVAAGYGNTTLIGIPLALAAYGAEGSVPMALIVAVQLADHDDRRRAPDGPRRAAGRRRRRRKPMRTAMAKAVGRNLVGNPIIIGLLRGPLWRLSAFPSPACPAELDQSPRRRGEHARPLRHGHEPPPIRHPRQYRPRAWC